MKESIKERNLKTKYLNSELNNQNLEGGIYY